jgi:ADP-dependent NAD(P)H-hydrate dehydratase / NAD(P)H-hydrate epimerase
VRLAYRVVNVRAAESALMANVPAGALMHRAAAGLARRCAQLLADRFGGVYGRRVLLLCGTGDNGGDALFAGALLAERGAVVSVLPVSGDRIHTAGLNALRAAGGRVVPSLPPEAELVVEGITGIGGRGPLHGTAAEVVEELGDVRANDGDTPLVVAVDVPAGIDVETGDVAGPALRADVTVTFGCLKPGLLVGLGATRAGQVDLVDIGLEPWLRGEPAVRVPDIDDIARWWPRPHAASDKYTRGVVGVATGSVGYSGAAVLSTAGALAGPVGLVRREF